MATCHHTHAECLAPHIAGHKRAGSTDGRLPEKRAKLCNLPSDLHAEIAHIMHVTRKRSHELAKLLCTSPPLDHRLICHQLDPSIFDAEVSEDEDDLQETPPLLPEVRSELQYLLEPRCLDATYDERAELPDTSKSDDSGDELPDLDDNDGLEDLTNGTDDKILRTFRTSHLKVTNTTEIIPVLDKLKLLPVVSLTRVDDFQPHITKKLKLNTDRLLNGALVQQNKFVWSQEHHSRLRSILCSVGQRLSATKTSYDVQDVKGVNGSCEKVGIRKPLKIQMSNDDDLSDEQPRIFKPWSWNSSDSSDSDFESTDSGRRGKQQRQIASHPAHWQCPKTRLCSDHPVHASLAMHSSINTVYKLSQCIADVLESCDREDEDFQLRFLRLCHSCLAEWLKWPTVLLHQLFRLIMDGSCPSVQWGAYDILCTLLTIGSSVHLPFTWQHLCNTTERLLLWATECRTHSVLGPALALQYMVSALELDTFNAPSRRRSHAARWFAADQKCQCASQIVSWVLKLVSLDQTSASSCENVVIGDGSTLFLQVPSLVSSFQRLLDLSFMVSGAADMHTSRLITELSQGYVRLKTYAQRHLLVSTIKPSVIVFKLCTRILNDYGSSKMVSKMGESTYPSTTISDLIDIYSTSVPLDQHLTEMVTADVHKEDEEIQKREMRYSSSDVEELAFLTWSLICAYVKINKDKDLPPPADLDVRVQQLEAQYSLLTVQLSPKTQLYLKMIESLTLT
ncbi:hypothetical protein LSH36_198g03013 [Paralvinella palmiformis]|uniref:Uncharacterized protein n=1 Tax=Paralvinella palmiformis TaxID=53620 RepID=A0AAD9JQK0_9ANNE|nr:hypothetical protein LSH36_198g03013 [Paralvinella palmiformis]